MGFSISFVSTAVFCGLHKPHDQGRTVGPAADVVAEGGESHPSDSAAPYTSARTPQKKPWVVRRATAAGGAAKRALSWAKEFGKQFLDSETPIRRDGAARTRTVEQQERPLPVYRGCPPWERPNLGYGPVTDHGPQPAVRAVQNQAAVDAAERRNAQRRKVRRAAASRSAAAVRWGRVTEAQAQVAGRGTASEARPSPKEPVVIDSNPIGRVARLVAVYEK